MMMTTTMVMMTMTMMTVIIVVIMIYMMIGMRMQKKLQQRINREIELLSFFVKISYHKNVITINNPLRPSSQTLKTGVTFGIMATTKWNHHRHRHQHHRHRRRRHRRRRHHHHRHHHHHPTFVFRGTSSWRQSEVKKEDPNDKIWK